jgi:hypothetical protein
MFYTNIMNDNSLEGVYTIRVTISTPYTIANPQLSSQYFYDFTLTVTLNCSIEAITSIPMSATSYQIYAGTLTIPIPAWTVWSHCPLTYSVLVNGLDPTQAKLSSEERSIVEFDSATREITVFSQDNQHGGKQISIEVTAQTDSINNKSETFTLTTSINCNYATLDLDSTVNRTLEYSINNVAPLTLT